MFRAHKTLSAFLAALLLTALQLHSVLHLSGHEQAGGEAPCSACVESLQQIALEGPAPIQVALAPLAFALAEATTVRFRPQFLSFAPLFRGPPAVS